MAFSSVLKQVISAYPTPEKLKIRDLARVGTLLETLISQGPSKFQVIADFDRTMSKSKHPNGEEVETGNAAMNNSPLLPDSFRDQAKALFSKYHPIEVDHELSIKEKIPLMVEWYERRTELVIAAKFTKSDVARIVRDCKVFLRDGLKESFSALNVAGVPVLVFSAGNGNILEGVMKRDDAHYPNVHVISNYFKFDENDVVIGYQNAALIHAFNKNEHAVENCDYFEELKHRSNALLLGDSIGDVSMDSGMPNLGAVLKIGFLNDHAEERMTSFLEAFDVVLIDDQSFKFINLLLDCILNTRINF